jgi:endonuclease-3
MAKGKRAADAGTDDVNPVPPAATVVPAVQTALPPLKSKPATDADLSQVTHPVNVPSKATLKALFGILGPMYPTHPLAVTAEDHFQVLVAAMLSARTKDPTTNAAMARLWDRASTPQGILAIAVDELAAILHPVGFHTVKARNLHAICRMLIDEFDGRVPQSREELLRFPGVGRKVANLVLNICFLKAAICVDIHVHRISNRLGWVVTKSPEETEYALMELVPEQYWTDLNRVLVNHGQQICQPMVPYCSRCPIYKYCARVGVSRNR